VPVRARTGLTLAELAVVIALLGVLGGAIGSVLVRQQRFTADASVRLRLSEGVRDAMEIVAADIRGTSPADTIRLLADSALELYAGIGTSIVCRAASSTAFALAAEHSSDNTLTGFLVQPDTGDLALLYVGDGAGRRWERHRIVSFGAKSPGAGCLLDDADPREGFTLTVQSPPAGTVGRGTPVRFIRRGRYSHYRSSDREWYLGYRRCNAMGASICGAIQPVSGPYRGYDSDRAKTGLLFEYFDDRGEVVSGELPLSVARIDITARAGSPAREAGRRVADSATASIAIRN